MAGAASVALAGVAFTLSTRTVQADAPLARPALTAPPAVAAVNPSPALTTPQKPAGIPAEMLHGIASWYGGVFNGRRTASGERYNMYAMTACHPTLPFGTLVRVKNRENQLSVVVKITDRGDLLDGRILDLSYGAAQKLAMTEEGVVPVDVEVISMGGAPARK